MEALSHGRRGATSQRHLWRGGEQSEVEVATSVEMRLLFEQVVAVS